jgi:hypothetical protein
MTIADDRGVPKNTEEKLGILGAETVDMIHLARLIVCNYTHHGSISH